MRCCCYNSCVFVFVPPVDFALMDCVVCVCGVMVVLIFCVAVVWYIVSLRSMICFVFFV